MGSSETTRGGCENESTGIPRVNELGSARRHPLVLKLGLSLVSLLCALLVAELVLRCLTPQQLGFRYQNRQFMPPKLHVRDKTRNRLGYHDVDHSELKPPGVRRVILLGDSYVAAGAVRVPETPGQRLEHHLNTRAGQRYEVISIGKGGWGPAEQLRRFRRVGVRYSPDIVVTLFLSFNDVENSSQSLSLKASEHRKTHQSQRLGRTRVRAKDMPLFFFRWSVLNQLISYRLAYLLRDKSVGGISPTYFVYAEHYDEEWEEAWRNTEKLIRQTKEAVTSVGARYVVVAASTPHGVWGAEEGLRRLMAAYPGMKELQWDLDKPDRRIERFCKHNDIPFLALEPVFRVETIENGKRLHIPINGHWNAEGTDLAGKHIANLLLSLEDPPKPVSPQ